MMDEIEFDLHVMPVDDGVYVEFSTEDGERVAYTLPYEEATELRDALSTALTTLDAPAEAAAPSGS